MQDSSRPIPQLGFHEGTLRLSGVSDVALERLFGGERRIGGENLFGGERLYVGEPLLEDLASVRWTFDPRQGCYLADAFQYPAVASPLRTRLTPPIDDQVFASLKRGGGTGDPIVFPHRSTKKLREDQREAIGAWETAGKRGIIVMPTGTGKTVVAIETIRRSACPTLIVVPIRDLMYQWHARILESTGVDAGLIGDGVHRVSPISVTTYDSAAIHMPRLGNRFEFIIFDEVHHLAGQWRADAARMSAAIYRLGLTATMPSDPERLASIETLIGPRVFEDTIHQARGKTLADYQIRRIPVQLSETERRRYRELSGIVQAFVADRRKEHPSFRWEQIYALANEDAGARRCLRAHRLKNRLEERARGKLRILEDLFRLHLGEPILVFVGSNAMAREISLRFLVPCLLSHCGKRERADLLRGFAEGTYPVLVANRVLDEGVDLPEVKVAIVLGGTASGRQAIQRLGRVLRKGVRREAVLYEIVTEGTGEVQRSRTRRRNDAYRPSSRRSTASVQEPDEC